MTSLPISSITINRAERQRRELIGIPELADSIRRNGLIHPPAVGRDNVLIAGERRLEACKSLGWTHIEVRYIDEFAPEARKAIELEENIKRVDITWPDQCRAIEEYHKLRSSEPGWSTVKTAEALGISQASISQKLAVAEEIKTDEKIATAPKYSVANNLTQRKRERARANEADTFRASISSPETPVPEAGPGRIECANFLEWATTYSGPKFNLIHCDFPYGINADKIQQGSAVATLGSYDDSSDTYFTLLGCLLSSLDRLALPSCHIIFWFSLKYYVETLDAFAAKSDFIIDRFPLVWHKSDNAGVLPNPGLGPRRTYETALFGYRGNRPVVSAVANSTIGPTTTDIHQSVKPINVLHHFFRMVVDGSTRLLDPTCGSGTSIRVAETLGAETALGLEVNPDYARLAQDALDKQRRK